MSAALARARALIGTPFRAHGRDPATGLDCVGLVVAALAVDAVPGGYALRSGDLARLAATAARAGLILVAAPAPGDLLAFAAATGLHLAIAGEASIVHACARLRRVVERPAPWPWPLAGAWRQGS